MRKFYSRALLGALVGGGLAVLGYGIANAAETPGADGLLSGDQAAVSVDLPVTVGGNAVSAIGDSHSEDADTSAPAPDAAPVTTTDGSDGVASGNQGIISVDVPVTVGGNAVSVIGDSRSEDADTSVPAEPAAEPETAPEQPPLHVTPAPTDEVPGKTDSVTTDGTDSIGGGNQAIIPVEVPVTIGGNAVSVIGDSHSENATTTGDTTGTTGTIGDVETDGTDSIGGGNQAIIPVAVPVTVGGNAVSVIGDSHSEDATTTGNTTGTTGSTGDVETDGTDSLLGGNQAIIPIAVPVTIGGNAVSGIGDSTSTGATTTGGAGDGGLIGGIVTDGTGSIGGGN
ncbi:hypothetical protein NS206_12730, partial [Microbacterium testaceum]|uniref:chaplin family protein n=1 Tax=Microbacterium testaceum TaxID=2033 RepID=UPI0007348B1B